MTLACIVLAYRLPEQLARLLSVLRHGRIRIYLHVDRRVPMAPFTRVLSEADLCDVALLRRRASRWGSIECVDAALEGLARGVVDGCDYFLLISGQDFPLRSASEILRFAEEASSRSYIEHWPTAASRHRFGGRDRTDFYTYTILGRRELCIPRGEDVSFLGRRGRTLNHLLRMRSALKPTRRFPAYLDPFVGATWWNLSKAAAEWVLRFVDEHPDYRRYHVHTWVPEEMFFQSVLAGTDFTNRHELIDDNLRFYDWEGLRARTLTIDDLPAILNSGKLFARKLDASIDASVLARLAERVWR
jgi:Core-2/I-Branching enzyme